MGEILPDGTIQGYFRQCEYCGKEISTNIQGNTSHACIKQIQQLQADKEELEGKWNECRIVNSYIVEQSTKLPPGDFFPWIRGYDLKPGEVQYEEAKTSGTWEKHQDSTQEG